MTPVPSGRGGTGAGRRRGRQGAPAGRAAGRGAGGAGAAAARLPGGRRFETRLGRAAPLPEFSTPPGAAGSAAVLGLGEGTAGTFPPAAAPF